MKKRRLRLEALSIAVFLSLNPSVAAIAAGNEETDVYMQEEILLGTADEAAEEVFKEDTEENKAESEIEEEIFSGTADIAEEENVQLFKGTRDVVQEEIEPQADAAAESALNKAENYMKSKVTSPVVGSIGGEWAVMAMARYNMLDENTRMEYLTNLFRTLDDKGGILATTNYTEYSRVIMALSSIGIDPGNANGYNLLEPLADFKSVKYQGINGSIFALIALDTRHYEIPQLSQEDLKEGKVQTTREGLIAEILGKEIKGGGWSLLGKKADPDITAMVLQALAPYRDRADVSGSVERGIEKLKEMQYEDGGYASEVDGTPTRNLESTAQTIIALSAIDASLINSDGFMKKGRTLIDELLRFQLKDGSFAHVEGNPPVTDQMSTEQGTLALAAWCRAVNGQQSLYDMAESADENPDGAEPDNGNQGGTKPDNGNQGGTKPDNGNQGGTKPDNGNQGGTKPDNGNQGGTKPDNENKNEESVKNVEKFRAKLEALPAQVTIADKDTVYKLKTELGLMKEFEEKEKFRNLLNGKIEDISIQEQEAASLDEDIWNQIDPLNITIKDKETVEELVSRYHNLPDVNKTYIKNSGDLERADIVVKKLEKGIIAGEVFENVKNSKKNYLYEGKDYTIRLKGKNGYVPKDMKAGINKTQKKDSLDFSLEEKGVLPGEVQISIKCTLEDGVYMLCRTKNGEQKNLQWTAVSGGYMTCDISEGGDYTVKRENLGYGGESGEESTIVKEHENNDLMILGSKSTGGPGNTETGNAGTGNRGTGNSGSGTARTSAAPAKTSTSNTVKAEIKNGIVEKKAFEDIKGRDKNLKIQGETAKDKPYAMIINGRDIKKAEDMKAGIKEKSQYENDMNKLAENPYSFYFEHKGEFPGEMLVELTVDCKDGEYLLLYYNADKKKAEYVQKVEVKEKQTKFIVSEGGDYFIAKKAKTKSIDEIEAEEKKKLEEEKKNAEETDKKESTVKEAEPKNTKPEEEELMLTGTKEEVSMTGKVAAAAAVMLGLGAVGGVWYVRKKK